MPAAVRFGGIDATISGYVWSSEDESLAGMLNAMLPAGGPSGADPNPDGTAAQEAVRILRGELVSVDSLPSETGSVY